LDFSPANRRAQGRHAVQRDIRRVLEAKVRSMEAPSPGLEPELSEPKSEVLPITPRRIVINGSSAADVTLVCRKCRPLAAATGRKNVNAP
jgi:hypothetical protein